MSIISPETKMVKEFSPEEFRVIFHRELNKKELILERLCEETDMLSKLNPKTDRKLITTLEGDIIEYDGQPYLAHMLYVKLFNNKVGFENKFYMQRGQGKAAHFDEVINYLIKNYKPNMGALELDVELKDNLSWPVIERVDNALKNAGIPYYFASFYKEALKKARVLNPEVRTARHTLFSIGDEGYTVPLVGQIAGMGKPNSKYDPTITIAQYRFRFGNPTNIMHTPMHTPEQLMKMMQDKSIKGAFTDIKLFEPYRHQR